ncbi:MAG TPA: DUF262 domain-containing protein [Chitinophagales bacterium]|nr:DUF262 domain-containing protein [Chitinophagales bacterium]
MKTSTELMVENYELASDIEEIDESSFGAIPFNPKAIDITPKQLTLDNIIKRIKFEEINFSAEFQRHADLWDEEKQSRLIESILLRLPLPSFYFDATEDDKWQVVDGLQRLSAIRNFVVKQSLKLNGLEYLQNLNGLLFNELPRQYQRRIEETNISVYIINPSTPIEVKFNLFKRINTGGLVLKPQEIRYALNQGTPAEFLSELADLDIFKLATQNRISPKRMEDRDFVNRFLAFYLTDYSSYQPDLDSFLTKSLQQLNKLNRNELQQIKQSFIQALELSNFIFAETAFRKIDKSTDRKLPINKALFEVWTVLFAKITMYDMAVLKKNKDALFAQFAQLFNNEYFVKSISQATGDVASVRTRFSTVQTLLQEFINA